MFFVSIVINILLVALGYYLGLKKTQKDLNRLINDSEELQNAFKYYASERGITDRTEGDTDQSEPAGDMEQGPDGRVYKFFNMEAHTSNESEPSEAPGKSDRKKDPENERSKNSKESKKVYNKYTP